MDSIDISSSGLSALATAQAVTAGNLANLNTDGYAPRAAVLETGPGGDGVRVADVYARSEPAAAYPTYHSSGRSSGSQASTALTSDEDVQVRPSQVDPARETVDMIAGERAFGANLAAVRTAEDMKGTFFDRMI